MYAPKRSSVAMAALATVVLLVAGSHAAITLNINNKFQTVDGFGSHHNIRTWSIKIGPFWHEVDLAEVGFYDSLAQDMSLMRMSIPPMQPSEGAPYNQVDFTHAIALHQRGVNRFLGSCWSPPGWMKDNGTEIQGGHLLPQYYDDFGRLCAEYARQFREKVGIDLYALSLQNEPLFYEPYSSCQYTNATYRDLTKTAGPIIDAVSPATKLCGAEDVLVSASRCNGWVQAILGDAQAAPHFDIYGVHCHTQIYENPNDNYRNWWNTVRNVADPNNFPLWQSEVGDNFATDWHTAVLLGCTIANSFKYGNCAAWIWWTLSSDNDNAMVRQGVYNGKYWQQAHFGRFVKPGARRIESSSSNGQLRECAFENTDGSVAVVVFNKTSGAINASVNGSGLPAEYRAYQTTSEASHMQDMGIFALGANLSLPGNSMTSFTSNTTVNSYREKQVAREAALKFTRVPLANGTTVTMDVPEPSRVSLTVFATNGEVVGRLAPRTAAGKTTLKWRDAQAAGTYVGRLRVQPLNGGDASEHVVGLTAR